MDYVVAKKLRLDAENDDGRALAVSLHECSMDSGGGFLRLTQAIRA